MDVSLGSSSWGTYGWWCCRLATKGVKQEAGKGLARRGVLLRLRVLRVQLSQLLRWAMAAALNEQRARSEGREEFISLGLLR